MSTKNERTKEEKKFDSTPRVDSYSSTQAPSIWYS